MTVGHSDTQPTEEETHEIGGVKVMTPHTAQLPTARDLSILLAQATDIPPMETRISNEIITSDFYKI